MTKAVVLITPAASRDAVAAELEALGYGPGIPSAPYVHATPAVYDMKTGEYVDQPTHYVAHWWINDNEGTVADLEMVVQTHDVYAAISGDPVSELYKIDTDPADSRALMTEVFGASVEFSEHFTEDFF